MRDDLALLQKGASAGNELALKVLADQPTIEWPWHWWAFHELSTDRPATQGALLPIPLTAIRAMADEWNLCGNAEHTFEDTSQTTTYRGYDAVDPFDVKTSWKFTISYIKEALYWLNWFPLLREIGLKKAILFVPDSSSTYLQNEAVFGRIVSAAKGSPVSSDFYKLELYVREI